MKKIISLALAVVMVMTLLPMTMLSVFAAETDTTEKNITLGTSALSGYDSTNGYKYVYYGTYNNESVKWRVLDMAYNYDKDDSNKTGMLVLLENAFARTEFGTNSTWNESTAQGWCTGMYNNSFGANEQKYILETNSDDILNNDRLFFLSRDEANKSEYFPNDSNRVANLNGYGVWWWLRSPFDSDHVDCVSNGGPIDNLTFYSGNPAARPAFNLNLSSVLFTSAAKGGKTTFSANTALTGSDGYKLTMLDTSRSTFSAEIFKTANKTYVKYQGATTGANEHITAMIVNANGEVTYYGSLKNITGIADASGMFEIDLSGMNSGDKVYILNEQWNGDYKTDYASALKEAHIHNALLTEVTYGVSEKYTVTIPAETTLNASGTSIEISATNVVIPYGNQLTVSISSSNYADSKWYLVDSASASNKLEYSIKNGENAVASDDTILTVAAGTTEVQTTTLTAKLVGTATYSGTYKDTLTFSVNVGEASTTEE